MQQYPLTGVVGTGNLGTTSVIGNATVALTGVLGTARLGTATVSASANFSVTGVSAIGID